VVGAKILGLSIGTKAAEQRRGQEGQHHSSGGSLQFKPASVHAVVGSLVIRKAISSEFLLWVELD